MKIALLIAPALVTGAYAQFSTLTCPPPETTITFTEFNTIYATIDATGGIHPVSTATAGRTSTTSNNYDGDGIDATRSRTTSTSTSSDGFTGDGLGGSRTTASTSTTRSTSKTTDIVETTSSVRSTEAVSSSITTSTSSTPPVSTTRDSTTTTTTTTTDIEETTTSDIVTTTEATTTTTSTTSTTTSPTTGDLINILIDGSFESGNADDSAFKVSDLFGFNFQTAADAGVTPFDGNVYLDVPLDLPDSTVDLYQDLTGLDTNAEYTLNVRDLFSSDAQPGCALTATLEASAGATDGQVILTTDVHNQADEWTTHTATFTPESASGTLHLQYTCQFDDYVDLYIDGIELLGPSGTGIKRPTYLDGSDPCPSGQFALYAAANNNYATVSTDGVLPGQIAFSAPDADAAAQFTLNYDDNFICRLQVVGDLLNSAVVYADAGGLSADAGYDIYEANPTLPPVSSLDLTPYPLTCTLAAATGALSCAPDGSDSNNILNLEVNADADTSGLHLGANVDAGATSDTAVTSNFYLVAVGNQ